MRRLAAVLAVAGSWIPGDTHVHTDHSSDGSSIRQGVDQGAPGNVSVRDQIRQAERVRLGFLTLTDHRTYDQHWDPLWRSDELILVPGEEANGSPHANVHGAADELVDGANPAGSAPYRHIQQSIWDVHAQNASWQTNHPDDGEWTGGGKPTPSASAVGVDTVEVWNRASDPAAEIAYAENRWNAGYRFGVTGASDNHFKEIWAVAGPGNPTTWVFAPAPTERGIVAGLRAGHTSVSVNRLGPRVALTADADGDGVFESMGGDEVTATGGRGTLKVRVWRGVGSKVVVYGAPGRSRGPLAEFRVTRLDQAFTLPLSSNVAWYRAEVRGVGAPPGLATTDYGPSNALLALTSPLFVDTGTRAAPRAEIPLPPVAGGDDAALPAIAEPSTFVGWSDVAAVGSVAHVVAERNGGGRASVLYSRAGAASVTLSAPGASARFPSVTARGNNVWAVWQEDRGKQTPHRTNIVLRHSGDGGATWDAPRALTATGHAQHPTIEATPGAGRVIAAWADNARSAFDVYVRDINSPAVVNVSAPGKRVRAGGPLDTRSARHPASIFPTLALRGERAVVAWADNRRDVDAGWTGSRAGEGTAPDDWEVFAATRNANGSWTAPVNVSNDPKRADRHPSLAFTGNGGVVVAAWDSKELKESDVNVDVRYAEAPPTGVGWTRSKQVGFDAAAMSQHPAVVAAGDGARIVWHDSRSADWRWSIWSAGLTPTGASTAVRLTGAGNALYPSAAGPFVAFTSDRQARRLQRDVTNGVFVLRD